MFLLKLLQIMFFLVLGYLLYQVIRFFFTLGKGTRDARKKMEEQVRRGRNPGTRGRNDDKIIELDKDQYKVD